MKKAESLKDIVNIFKPEALKGEQEEYYQKTAGVRGGESYEFHEGLLDIIDESSVYERLLVVGHGGCGKTTELNMMGKKLSDKGYPVIHIQAEGDLDLYNFNYIDIFVLIVEKLARYAKDNNYSVSERLISTFTKALSTKVTIEHWSEESEIGADGSVYVSSPGILRFLSFVAKITASLKHTSGFREEYRNDIKPSMSDIIASLNALVKHLSDKAKHKTVVIIDGLEKCRHEAVRKLFVEDISAFTEIQSHVVLSCPISVYRSVDAAVLSGYFSSPVVIPMIKTHNIDGSRYSNGVDVIRELLLKRADEVFFETDVLDTIIKKSGGSLRDTSRLLSRCAFEAKMRKRSTIDMDSVNFTMKKFATDVFFRVNARFYARAKKIYDGDHVARQDDEFNELLYCGAAFEYNGDRWVDLHPLVRQYIDDHPGVFKV